MEIVNLRTPLLLAAMMALAFGGVLFALRHSLAIQGTGVRRWAHGDIVVGFGMLLLGLHDRLPDVLTVALAEVLLVTGVALQHHALRAFMRLRPRTGLESAAIVLAVAQAIAFWHVVDVPGARALALTALALALCGSMAAATLAAPVRRMPGASLIGVGLIVMLALIVVRTATIIGTLGTAAELLDWHPVQVPLYFSSVVFVALINLGFVVMVDARRRGDVERLATVDSLTGLLNRRMLMTVAEKVLAQARRNGRPLALLMIDLDSFKAVNDRHGHAAGDAALEHFARIAESGIRAGDVLGRYGGEEFVAVLPDTTEEVAAAIAERVRSTVETDAMGAGSPPRCTVSIGVVATTEPARASLDELLHAADDALYRAKRTRNAVATAAAPDAAQAVEPSAAIEA